MAAVQALPVRVGDVDLLVETVTVAGSEPTGVSDAAERVLGAFVAAESAVEAICERVARIVESTAAKAARPSSLVVEFGLKFSAKGNVIVAGASGEASLKVTITYESSPESG